MPENAAPALRAILPADMTARIDLEKLALVPGTFVDEALRQRHTDVLFTAPLARQDVFIYVLMEHQSKSDPDMAYRMARYVFRIWERFREENPDARRLPDVIPLVVYNGTSRWSAPLRLQDLIGPGPTEGTGCRPRLSYLLFDLSVIDVEDLIQRIKTPIPRVTLVLFKEAPGNDRAHEVFWKLIDDLRAIFRRPDGDQYFKTLLNYSRCVNETPDSEYGRVADALGPEAKEAYMTTAEMLEARGEARGATRGKAEGRAEALIQILEVKFGLLPEDRSKEINEASSDQLREWTTRAVTASTLDEVFD